MYTLYMYIVEFSFNEAAHRQRKNREQTPTQLFCYDHCALASACDKERQNVVQSAAKFTVSVGVVKAPH